MKTTNFLCPVFSFLFLITVFSCSNDDNTENEADSNFSGYYRIVSILSDKEADLNNDGIKSKDILFEMTSPYIMNGNRTVAFYNPDSPGNYAEVEFRPANGFNEEVKFIAFNYPCQNIIDEDGDNPILRFYWNQFYTYTYELTSSGKVEITDINPEYNAQYGEINSVWRTDEDSFTMDLSTKIYDFKGKGWIDANVIVQYLKVEL